MGSSSCRLKKWRKNPSGQAGRADSSCCCENRRQTAGRAGGSIKRASAYIKAGADAVFPEALQSESEFRAFSKQISVPILANMTEFGQTPYYSADEFSDMGCQMVIYPVTSLRTAAKAFERIFRLLKEEGSQKRAFGYADEKELYETIAYHDYEELDQSIAKTILPDD